MSWIRVNVPWAADSASARTAGELLDSLANLAPEQGLEVVVTVTGSWKFVGGQVDARYLAFLEQSVRRHGARLQVWQIENEVQSRNFWPRPIQDYDRVLERAYPTVKAASPSATVLLAGLPLGNLSASTPTLEGPFGGGGSLQDRERFVAANMGHFDAIDLHLYHTLESIPGRVAYFRSALHSLGSDAEIWVTELGGPDRRSGSTGTVSLDDVAREIPKRLLVTMAAGVSRAAWHELESQSARDPTFGPFALHVGGRARPGWGAFQRTASILQTASRVVEEAAPAGVQLFRLEYAARTLFAAWSDHGVRCLEGPDGRTLKPAEAGNASQPLTPSGCLSVGDGLELFVSAGP